MNTYDFVTGIPFGKDITVTKALISKGRHEIILLTEAHGVIVGGWKDASFLKWRPIGFESLIIDNGFLVNGGKILTLVAATAHQPDIPVLLGYNLESGKVALVTVLGLKAMLVGEVKNHKNENEIFVIDDSFRVHFPLEKADQFVPEGQDGNGIEVEDNGVEEAKERLKATNGGEDLLTHLYRMRPLYDQNYLATVLTEKPQSMIPLRYLYKGFLNSFGASVQVKAESGRGTAANYSKEVQTSSEHDVPVNRTEKTTKSEFNLKGVKKQLDDIFKTS